MSTKESSPSERVNLPSAGHRRIIAAAMGINGVIALGAAMVIVGLSFVAWHASKDARSAVSMLLIGGGLAAFAAPIVKGWYRRKSRNEEPTFSWTILGATLAGLLVLMSYRWNARPEVTWQRIVELLLVAGAAMLTGLLIGFIFGIPRAAGQADERAAERFAANTNLEQISDWLTKIIIGVGLVETRQIGAAFDTLITNVSGAGIGSKPLVGAILVFFIVTGFLDGYLWTRIILTRHFTLSERELRVKAEFYEGLISAYLYQPYLIG